MQDKRLTIRLTQYWETLRRQSPLPRIEHFNAAALDDIIGKCCIWRVEAEAPRSGIPLYTSEYIGHDLKEVLGENLIGETLSPRFKHFPAARILDKVEGVLVAPQVTTDEGQFINHQSKIVKFRSCLLPFGDKEGKVTAILLGISWRAF